MSEYITFQTIVTYRVKVKDGSIEYVKGFTSPINGTQKAKKTIIKKDFNKKSEDVEVEEW